MRKTSFVSSPLSAVPAPSSFAPAACCSRQLTTDQGQRTNDQGRLSHSLFVIQPSYFTLHTSFTSAIGYKRPAIAEANEGGGAVFSVVHKSVIASISGAIMIRGVGSNHSEWP